MRISSEGHCGVINKEREKGIPLSNLIQKYNKNHSGIFCNIAESARFLLHQNHLSLEYEFMENRFLENSEIYRLQIISAAHVY